MPKSQFKVINQIDAFLNASNEDLSELTHLYLANSNLQAKLGNKNLLLFIAKLQLCTNLQSLNLSFNDLQDHIAGMIVSESNSLTKLRLISLRENKLSDTFIKQGLSHNTATIIPNCHLPDTQLFTIPAKDWRLAYDWTQAELLEIIDIAETIGYENSMLIKLHAHRPHKKKSQEQSPHTNLQTNFPMSVLLIHGQAFIIPKYAKNYMPEKIEGYNARHESKSYKAIKILISRDPDSKQLTIKLVKIWKINITRKSLTYNMLEHEAHNLFKTHHYSATVKRDYLWQYSNSNSRQYKNYLLLDYIDGNDGFDIHAAEFEYFGKITGCKTTAQQPYLLPSDKQQQYIQQVLAYLLEVVCCHAYGIIHLDIKPDNFMLSGNKVKLIDFEGSAGLFEQTESKSRHLKWTPSYSPLEQILDKISNFGTKYDAFSCGVTARQTMYPISLGTSKKGFLHERDFVYQKDFTPIERPAKIAKFETDLSEHFSAGIKLNYGENVAACIAKLTDSNEDTRSEIETVFFEMAQLYPQYTQTIFASKSQEIIANLCEIFAIYPEAQHITTKVLTQINFEECADLKFITEPNPTLTLSNDDPETLYAAINTLFKLQALTYYLSIYELCNGTLNNKMQDYLTIYLIELFKHPSIKPEEMHNTIYINQKMEIILNGYYKLRKDILNKFGDIAIKILKVENTNINHPIITQLNKLQAELRILWQIKTPLSKVASTLFTSLSAILENENYPALLRDHVKTNSEYQVKFLKNYLDLDINIDNHIEQAAKRLSPSPMENL